MFENSVFVKWKYYQLKNFNQDQCADELIRVIKTQHAVHSYNAGKGWICWKAKNADQHNVSKLSMLEMLKILNNAGLLCNAE